jgi:hypothetical protein
LPSELIAEAEALPVDTLDLMMEYGAYAEMKAAIDAADRAGRPMAEQPSGPLADLVRLTEARIASENYRG